MKTLPLVVILLCMLGQTQAQTKRIAMRSASNTRSVSTQRLHDNFGLVEKFEPAKDSAPKTTVKTKGKQPVEKKISKPKQPARKTAVKKK